MGWDSRKLPWDGTEKESHGQACKCMAVAKDIRTNGINADHFKRTQSYMWALAKSARNDANTIAL